MKVFHELAYQGYVLQDAAGAWVLSDPQLMEPMGAVDVLHISGYSAQVTGMTPQLNIQIEVSNDRSNFRWFDPTTPVIDALSLSTSGETLFQGVEALTTLPRLAYTRLRIWLTGTDARAFLRIWVTGRDQSRRSAGMALAANGGASAMARPMPKMQNGRNGMHGRKP